MADSAVYQLRLPQSVKAAVERLAKREGTSMNQLMATAVAEKIAVLETSDFYEERLQRLDYATFDRVMSRTNGEPPRDGDKIE